ncbi:hypothetical protein D210916BOD24_17360 [Alteromonas sp. D210916BOD_24]|uniref:NYN domain-containing protein n=1 Tax=Alteromonas sp. D210916BOD_24 TaxID=3157618 RepID=UPI00399D01B6
MQYRSIVLVDGENLVLRYQQMLKDGYKPIDGVIHVEDTFVWHPKLVASAGEKDVVRVAYYTTVVGDDVKLRETKEFISNTEYECKLMDKRDWYGTLVPYVFKKNSKKATTKSVDINLTIDALRYAYGSSIEQIVLLTGDGDYIPLLREIMSRGKMVQVFALSSGLNSGINHNVDDLWLIDDEFFEEEIEDPT